LEWDVYIINKIREWNSTQYLTCEISSWTVEEKFHISTHPCIILVFSRNKSIVVSLVSHLLVCSLVLFTLYFFSPYIVLNYVCGKYKVCHYLFRYWEPSIWTSKKLHPHERTWSENSRYCSKFIQIIATVLYKCYVAG